MKHFSINDYPVADHYVIIYNKPGYHEDDEFIFLYTSDRKEWEEKIAELTKINNNVIAFKALPAKIETNVKVLLSE